MLNIPLGGLHAEGMKVLGVTKKEPGLPLISQNLLRNKISLPKYEDNSLF
jgi:hypothetical protein